MIPLTPAWQERTLARRLERWEPRVGREATVTRFAALKAAVLAWYLLVAWLVFSIIAAAAGLEPVVVVLLVLPIVAAVSMVRSMVLSRRSKHQASKVAAIRDMAVPMRNTDYFDAWARTSPNARRPTPGD